MSTATARKSERDERRPDNTTLLGPGLWMAPLRPERKMPAHPAAQKPMGEPREKEVVGMDAHGGEGRNPFGELPAKERLAQMDDRLDYLRGKREPDDKKVEKPPDKEERESRGNMFRGWSPLLDCA